MYPAVKSVVPTEDYRLSIAFDNGECGIGYEAVPGFWCLLSAERAECIQTGAGGLRYHRKDVIFGPSIRTGIPASSAVDMKTSFPSMSN